ncbi:MAG: PadR family transcriptional regulator [Nitrososphaeraceae archaeon]
MIKKRFSAEYNMFVILEYLYSNSRSDSTVSPDPNTKPNSRAVSISKYHIMTKIPELKQQRQDRLSIILNTLEKNEFIDSTVTPNATFYRITEKGRDTYLKWVNEFLKFYREVRDEK